MTTPFPRFGDVAHLGHIELFTPKPEASLEFFTSVVGLHESGRAGDSVYLRGWGDYEWHTLKLTAHSTSGIGHMGLRVRDEATLQALHHPVRSARCGRTLGRGYCARTGIPVPDA